MSKFVIALVSMLVAGWMFAGSTASAHGYYPGCNCGPVRPVTHYKLIHTEKYLTHYHNTSVTKHVQRVRHITTITKIQPIIHIHEVTLVHHHTIVSTVNAYSQHIEHLMPIRYVQRSTKNFYDCHCGH